MNTTMRIALAAAAVVAVFLGFRFLLPPGASIGGPAETPVPTPTPEASALNRWAATPLEPGTYYIADRAITQAERLTFTVPAGWATDESFISKDKGGPGEVVFVTWVVSHIFPDVCDRSEPLVDVGTSVDELTNALLEQRGRVASAPTDTTLGGFPAKRVELTVPADLDIGTCGGSLRAWPDPGPNLGGGLTTRVGQTDVVYVVDVRGNRLAVVARHMPDSSQQDLAELQAIVDSIQIDP
jgi:hypothetical protein